MGQGRLGSLGNRAIAPSKVLPLKVFSDAPLGFPDAMDIIPGDFHFRIAMPLKSHFEYSKYFWRFCLARGSTAKI